MNEDTEDISFFELMIKSAHSEIQINARAFLDSLRLMFPWDDFMTLQNYENHYK